MAIARIVCEAVTGICAPCASTGDDASGVVPSFVQWIFALESATDSDTDCGAGNGPAPGVATGAPGACRSLRMLSGVPPIDPPAVSANVGVAVSEPSASDPTSLPGNVADHVCALPVPVSVPGSFRAPVDGSPSSSVTDTPVASCATPETTTSSPLCAMLTDDGVLLVAASRSAGAVHGALGPGAAGFCEIVLSFAAAFVKTPRDSSGLVASATSSALRPEYVAVHAVPLAVS